MTVKPTNILFPIVQWVDSFTFLTKTGHVGIVLQHKGIDSECINDAIAESYTARFRRAMKSFTDDFQIFQYVLKHDGAEILVSDHYVNELAGTAARARKAFLESRPDGLYQSELFLCFLYKPKNISSQPRPRGGISMSLKQAKRLRLLARELDRNRRALFIRAKSFIAEVGDLLAPRILSRKRRICSFAAWRTWIQSWPRPFR
jgi:type IV secretory pathway VirB4 component